MQNGLPFSILVVDDDSDDLLLIDEAFKEIGHAAEVKKFLSGKALLRYLDLISSDLYPTLIVLDNSLPELEATDLLSLLKDKNEYKNIPVVIYTTQLSPAKEDQLMQNGAYACFIKGNSLEEIVAVVKELVELAGVKEH